MNPAANGESVEPGVLEEESQHLLLYRTWGIYVFLALLGLFLVRERILATLKDGLTFSEFAYVGLVLVVIVLFGSWVEASRKELRYFFRWLTPLRYRPPETYVVLVVVLLLSALMALLLSLVSHPLWFGITYFVYIALDLFSWHYRLREIAIALDDASRALSENVLDSSRTSIYQQAVRAFELYYLLRPHRRRVVLTGVASALLTIGFAFLARQNPGLITSLYQLTFAALLVGSEVVIIHWRDVFDKDLYSLAVQLPRSRPQKTPMEATGGGAARPEHPSPD